MLLLAHLHFNYKYILQIYDGKDKTTHLLGAFTGASMRGLTLSSTSNQLWLEFNSDSEGTDEGFQLVYTSKYLGRIKLSSAFTEYLLNHCGTPCNVKFNILYLKQLRFRKAKSF